MFISTYCPIELQRTHTRTVHDWRICYTVKVHKTTHRASVSISLIAMYDIETNNKPSQTDSHHVYQLVHMRRVK